jgi:hypothetical protein
VVHLASQAQQSSLASDIVTPVTPTVDKDLLALPETVAST